MFRRDCYRISHAHLCVTAHKGLRRVDLTKSASLFQMNILGHYSRGHLKDTQSSQLLAAASTCDEIDKKLTLLF